MIWHRPFLLLLAGFLAGSLPLHLYQFRHPGPGLGLLTLLSFPEPQGLVKDFFANVLPILWGFRPPLTSDAGKLIGYGLMLGLNGSSIFFLPGPFDTLNSSRKGGITPITGRSMKSNYTARIMTTEA